MLMVPCAALGPWKWLEDTWNATTWGGQDFYLHANGAHVALEPWKWLGGCGNVNNFITGV